MAERQPVTIDVWAGTFDSQPLAYAHLFDLATCSGREVALEAVDVICKADPTARLKHYFTGETVDSITDGLGLNTTVLLVFPEAIAGGIPPSPFLTHLGSFAGTRPVADLSP